MPRVSARKCSQCIFHAKPAPHLDLDLDLRRALHRDRGLSSAGLSTTNCQLHLRNQITQAQLAQPTFFTPRIVPKWKAKSYEMFSSISGRLPGSLDIAFASTTIRKSLQPFATVCGEYPMAVQLGNAAPCRVGVGISF